MELYAWAQKLGINDIHISEDEWDKYYSNTYNILAIMGTADKRDLMLAAEDIIFIHELRKAGYEKNQEVVCYE